MIPHNTKEFFSTKTARMTDIQNKLKTYILEEFCAEAEVGVLNGDTALLSSGIIDSISSLQLVEFIEQTFDLQFEAHEVDQDNLDSLEKIETFILSKVKK